MNRHDEHGYEYEFWEPNDRYLIPFIEFDKTSNLYTTYSGYFVNKSNRCRNFLHKYYRYKKPSLAERLYKKFIWDMHWIDEDSTAPDWGILYYSIYSKKIKFFLQDKNIILTDKQKRKVRDYGY